MKKLICLIMALVMVLSCTAVFADEPPVTVKIDGEVVEFDVPAQIINDRTMVPMRKIFEVLGANVTWVDSEQMVIATKGTKTVSLVIGFNILSIHDSATGTTEKITLDVPAQLVDSRTLVPARAVSESLDALVDWDEANWTVLITSEAE